MASKQVPSVGRVVHYFWPEENIAYAAIITGVVPPAAPDSAVDLVVLHSDGLSFPQGVPHASKGEDRHRWAWPAFVPPVEVPDGA